MSEPGNTATVEFEPGDAPDQPGSPPADRQAYRRALGRFRSRRVLAASLVAIVLALLAILAAIEVISHLVGRPLGLLPGGALARFAREQRWDSAAVFTAAAVLAILGLILLLLAILPGRARVVPLATALPDTVLAARPHALARHAGSAAEAVPGVAHATARASRTLIRVRVISTVPDPAALTEQVRRAVAQRVGQFAPLRRPRVRVDVRRGKE